jgi:hypothetical protein
MDQRQRSAYGRDAAETVAKEARVRTAAKAST